MCAAPGLSRFSSSTGATSFRASSCASRGRRTPRRCRSGSPTRRSSERSLPSLPAPVERLALLQRLPTTASLIERLEGQRKLSIIEGRIPQASTAGSLPAPCAVGPRDRHLGTDRHRPVTPKLFQPGTLVPTHFDELESIESRPLLNGAPEREGVSGPPAPRPARVARPARGRDEHLPGSARRARSARLRASPRRAFDRRADGEAPLSASRRRSVALPGGAPVRHARRRDFCHAAPLGTSCDSPCSFWSCSSS
jgi:hypothetical protein